MTDGIIKGTGDSRYLKGAGWPSTYAEFKAMAEAGTLPFDLNGINAAGWQQIGTALSKGNLLDDVTASILGLEPSRSTVNNAFLKLGVPSGKYVFIIHVFDSTSGSGLAGIEVSGILTAPGTAAITDQNGVAVGMSTSSSATATVSGRIGLVEKTINIVASDTVTRIEMPIDRPESSKTTITSSRDFKFSPTVSTADFCLVGAGGSAGYSQLTGIPSGCGSGGDITNILNVQTNSADIFSAQIGAGGVDPTPSGRSDGNWGGGSTLKKNGSKIGGVSGGQGGRTWNGQLVNQILYGGSTKTKGQSINLEVHSGSPQFTFTEHLPAESSDIYKFNDKAEGLAGGGGGCTEIGSPGLPNGGSPRKLAGIGGGGACTSGPSTYSGADGGLFIRWRYK